MANRNFDYNALIHFIEGRVGKSVHHIAEAFGVSVRTVQRRIRKIRTDYAGLDIRESTDGGTKTYRCIRKGITVSMGLKKRDIMTLHKLGMASEVFRASGLIDHADAFDAHVESLMAILPRAVRNTCQRELDRLSKREQFIVAKAKPVARKGITEALQLAIVAQRKVGVRLNSGKGIRGAVEGISYGIAGAEVELSLQDGSCRAIPLNEIDQIDGIADLIADDLIRA